MGTVKFVARCPNNAEAVLGRAKEVLGAVLQQDANHWPSECAWLALLPGWFVAKWAPEASHEEAAQRLERGRMLTLRERIREEQTATWSLNGWLHWFERPQCSWFWWDAAVEDENSVRLHVQVDGWPFAWGALGWLFRACSATRLEKVEG